jgi:hypothetical protein
MNQWNVEFEAFGTDLRFLIKVTDLMFPCNLKKLSLKTVADSCFQN